MDIHDYILNDVKPLALDDSISKAQNIFSQLTYSHLPVMDGDLYIGSVSETDAHCMDSTQALHEVKYTLIAFHVLKETHWLDILEAFVKYDSNVMPVLDEHNNYIGYYELKDVMQRFSESPFLSNDGAVIEVQKDKTDYSFSEIAQIVESNDAQLHGVFISGYDGHQAQIIVKLSSDNVNAVLQTFRRYSYTVVSKAIEDTYLDSLKERSDYLDKYLNI